MEIEYIKKKFKQAECNHPAFRMLPIFDGLFGICWECTKCGIIKQEVGRK